MDPDLASAFRFMIWATSLGTAIIVGHYAWRNPAVRVPSIGVAIEALSWTLHQYYYWVRWVGNGDTSDHVSFFKIGPLVPTMCITVASIGAVLVMSPFLETVVGRWWPVLGYGALIALWGIGYGVAVTW